MQYMGVIFDFNGTLFWDSDKHEEAWKETLKRYGIDNISNQEFSMIHGRNSREVVEFFLNTSKEKYEIGQIINEKEERYRHICFNNIQKLSLAPGLTEFLIRLKEKGVKHTIATSADKTNVEFYIKIFKLYRWFDIRKIIYNDETFPGKPEPDIFIKASNEIGLLPEQCIVFEDSLSGIEAARRAGIGKIIAVGLNEKDEILKNVEGVDIIIKDFHGMDAYILF